MGERDTWVEEVDVTGAFQKAQWCPPPVHASPFPVWKKLRSASGSEGPSLSQASTQKAVFGLL